MFTDENSSLFHCKSYFPCSINFSQVQSNWAWKYHFCFISYHYLTHNLKTIWCIQTYYTYQTSTLLLQTLIFLFKVACKLRLASYGSQKTMGSFIFCPLCTETHKQGRAIKHQQMYNAWANRDHKKETKHRNGIVLKAHTLITYMVTKNVSKAYPDDCHHAQLWWIKIQMYAGMLYTGTAEDGSYV